MMDAIILTARICYTLAWIFLVICKSGILLYVVDVSNTSMEIIVSAYGCIFTKDSLDNLIYLFLFHNWIRLTLCYTT